MTNTQAKNLKASTIEVAICEVCFCSIPADQADTHQRWHEARAAKEATR